MGDNLGPWWYDQDTAFGISNNGKEIMNNYAKLMDCWAEVDEHPKNQYIEHERDIHKEALEEYTITNKEYNYKIENGVEYEYLKGVLQNMRQIEDIEMI